MAVGVSDETPLWRDIFVFAPVPAAKGFAGFHIVARSACPVGNQHTPFFDSAIGAKRLSPSLPVKGEPPDPSRIIVGGPGGFCMQEGVQETLLCYSLTGGDVLDAPNLSQKRLSLQPEAGLAVLLQTLYKPIQRLA